MIADLRGGARGVQDAVQRVQRLQHARPAGPKQRRQPVRHVEQRAQRLRIARRISLTFVTLNACSVPARYPLMAW